MDQIVLTDPNVTPSEKQVFAIIGDKSALWIELHDYLYQHHHDISEVWKFYNDGKCWLFRYLIKAKTICWISILESTFQVGFWFGAKAEPIILASDLPENVMEEYRNAKKTKIGSGIGIVLHNRADLENVIKLMELRIKIK
jgi:hypothetical protein